MSIYEYDQERHMRQEREQSYEKGLAQGFTDGQTEGKRSMAVNLARSGMPAEEIARIAETDADLIREWIREQI